MRFILCDEKRQVVHVLVADDYEFFVASGLREQFRIAESEAYGPGDVVPDDLPLSEFFTPEEVLLAESPALKAEESSK